MKGDDEEKLETGPSAPTIRQRRPVSEWRRSAYYDQWPKLPRYSGSPRYRF